MRAVVFKELGGSEVLQLRSVPKGSPKAGEVLIKLASVGLNRADLLFPQGRYFSKPVFSVPCTASTDPESEGSGSRACSRLGFEGAGTVVDIGQGTQYKIGDRVAFLNFDRVSEQGCLADYAIIPARQLLPTPDSIKNEDAGAIWIKYLTAWGGLVTDGNLQAGQTVVITAASNSVGIACIQVAKMLNAKVIATTTSDNKFEALYQAGADLVLNLNRFNYVEEVKSFTENKGTDLVFDAVAGPAIRHLIKGSKKGGKIIVQGMLDRRPMDIHAGVLMKRCLTIKGFIIGLLLDNTDLLEDAVKHITQGLNNGQLTPMIADHYPLESFQTAFELLQSGQHIGKIVVSPGFER